MSSIMCMNWSFVQYKYCNFVKMYTLILILNTDKFGKSSTLLPYVCCPLSFKVHLLNFYNDNDISLLECLLSMIYDSNLMAVSLT